MILEQLGTYGNAMDLYKSSPFIAPVRAKRGGNNDMSGVNYATFIYTDQTGDKEVTEASDRFHSEKHCWLALCQAQPAFKALRVANWAAGSFGGTLTPLQLFQTSGVKIKSVYTERDACSACSPFLNEILLADVKVYWSFLYPSPDTKKFEQPAEQVGIFGLLTLATGDSNNYAQVVQDNVRDGRVIGNKNLKSALK